ncbi:MAG: hypothetical protein RMK99_17065, partial [Anaerolineales bacterium]|nr:hypothetical protein [Anaerolineales bacterium]
AYVKFCDFSYNSTFPRSLKKVATLMAVVDLPHPPLNPVTVITFILMSASLNLEYKKVGS